MNKEKSPSINFLKITTKKTVSSLAVLIILFLLLFKYILFPNSNSSVLKDVDYWNEFGASIQDNTIKFDAEKNCKKSPSIMILHGWLLNSPDYYMNFITYLQEKGYDVLFPLYHDGILPHGLKDNLIENLEQIQDAQVDILIGHSQGGSLAAAIGLERIEEINPSKILIFTPGDGRDKKGKPVFASMRVKWDTKPADLAENKRNFTIITGTSDTIVGDFVAGEIETFVNMFLGGRGDSIERISLEDFDDRIADHYFILGGPNIPKNPGFIKYASGKEWLSVNNSEFPKDFIIFLDDIIPEAECLD